MNMLLRDIVKLVYLLLFVAFVNSGYSQTIVYKRMDTVVVQQQLGLPLKNPWAGGFNSMQFSEIDLDLDGKEDLVAFDRTGNRLTTFINNHTAGVIDYTYAPEYRDAFPAIHDWVLLRDFNCDGKKDIFTYTSGGFAVYENISTSSLQFKLITSLIYSDYAPDTTSVNMINLYVSSVDLPAIEDIDNDGDLDVLTFNIFGTGVEYHKNYTMERFGTCDSLQFKLKNNCWGYFSESFSSNSVNLHDTCSSNVVDPERSHPKGQSGGDKHSGSCILALDLNNDTVMDIVLGDITYSNMTALINGGTRQAGVITVQDTAFPANYQSTTPINIPIFPAGFYLDINSDKVKDLIASPNTPNAIQNHKGCWLYVNNGTDHAPMFTFQSDAFLQNGMIEMGEGSNPRFFDYDQDGDLDLIIGNYGFYTGPASYSSKLALYENIGTVFQPKFKLISSDFGGLSSINLNTTLNQPTLGICPTFGDLDGDGDEDMIVGDYEGKIHYFKNTPVGGKANFSLSAVNYSGIDVGQYATPQLIDVDLDNLLDLVIGERDGNLNYYQNTGTTSNPSFTLVTNNMGGVDTRLSGEFVGYSHPFLYWNGSQLEMLCGSNSGYLFKYGNIAGNLTGTYTLIDSMYQNIWDGIRSGLFGGDLNNDNIMDFVLGNHSGGCALFSGNLVTQAHQILKNPADIKIFPNPMNNQLHITAPQNVKVTLFDIAGRKLDIQHTGTRITINTVTLPAGTYIVEVSGNNIVLGHYKVIKK